MYLRSYENLCLAWLIMRNRIWHRMAKNSEIFKKILHLQIFGKCMSIFFTTFHQDVCWDDVDDKKSDNGVGSV